MTGARPYRYVFFGYAALYRNLAEPLARGFFYAFHAKHKLFVLYIALCYFLRKPAKSLAGNAYYNGFGMLESFVEITGKFYAFVKTDVLVSASFFQNTVTVVVLRSETVNLVSQSVVVPGKERTPSTATENGYFHLFLLLGELPDKYVFCRMGLPRVQAPSQ